ncbi:MAG: MBL fold metallo-hydrolase [Candidatus Buchananbacteria bacterium]|nr:MBL fold metallo-hydrolase [Candidatus Buchananbacteria bacterium]
MSRKARKIIFYYFSTIVLVLVVVGHGVASYDPSLKVYFLDVGQGDATLIKTPDYQYILIDGGRDNSVLYGLGRYMPFYVRTIDLVVLTHPDADHLVGFNEVLKRYSVRQVLLTGVSDENEAYQNFLSLINNKVTTVWLAGATRSVSLAPDIDLEVLYPDRLISGKNFTQDNDWSIVSRLDYDGGCVLFMGDATKLVEKRLIGAKEFLTCKILKVGHHGSNTSSDKKFLEAVSPVLGVISVGQNRYGHPSPEVVERLTELGTRVLTTKSDGDIIVTLKKSGYIVE